MTEIENQTLNLLKILIENKDKIFENINEAKEKLIPTVNIINILGNTYSEVPNSSLLHNLLKIKFKYDNKEINFAKDFSSYVINNIYTENTEIDDAIIKYMLREHNIHIGEKTAEEIKINIGDAFKGDISKTMDIRGRDSINGLPKTETVNIAEVRDAIKDKIKDAKFENVYREFQTKDGRRIDILIVFDTFEIIIENKIGAGDQPKQLQDYYENRVKDNDKIKDNIFIVYLTRYGDKPSEYSINKELLEDLEKNNKICYLLHGDIADWIENDILNKYEFLKFDKKYQSIYSALIQIAYNEKFISKKTEENKMEINEIKKFFEENKYFENLLNEDEPVKDNFNKLNKFYELLENAQKVILDKKVELVSDDINYSLKVIEFIKSVQSNKGEDYMKGANFYSGVVNYDGYSLNINIPIENTNCGIYLDYNINYHLCVSVYYNNNYIANKLREEPIKTEIRKILDKKDNSDKYTEDEARYYIYCLYIDTEKYKPEEIGQKIIDLYDLLKEKIAQ